MTTEDVRTARRRTVIGTVLAAVLAAALVAIVVVRSNGEKVVNAGGDTLVLVDRASGEGMQATGAGTLADVGGCLGWAPRRGETAGTVVIWPHGTNVETPEPLRIRVAGKVYGIGDTVRIAGGEIGPLTPSNHFYDKVPKACRSANVFVANNG